MSKVFTSTRDGIVALILLLWASAILIFFSSAAAETTEKRAPAIIDMNKASLTEVQRESNPAVAYIWHKPSDAYKVEVILKNGSSFIADGYKRQNGYIKFFISEGMIEMDEKEIAEIKEIKRQADSQESRVGSQVSPPLAGEPARETSITKISVERKTGLTEIQIETDSPAAYVMYKPSALYKGVELNNADLGKFADTKKVILKNGSSFIVDGYKRQDGYIQCFMSEGVIELDERELAEIKESIVDGQESIVRSQEVLAEVKKEVGSRESIVGSQGLLPEVKKEVESRESGVRSQVSPPLAGEPARDPSITNTNIEDAGKTEEQKSKGVEELEESSLRQEVSKIEVKKEVEGRESGVMSQEVLTEVKKEVESQESGVGSQVSANQEPARDQSITNTNIEETGRAEEHKSSRTVQTVQTVQAEEASSEVKEAATAKAPETLMVPAIADIKVRSRESGVGSQVLREVKEEIKEQEKPAIANISVKEKAGFTEIQIESNSPFTYAMYKTSDPHKVVVELNNIDLGGFTDRIVVGRDGIAEIVPTMIESPQRVAKFDITMAVPSEVKPSLEGNSLVLSVSKSEVKEVKKEEKPAAASTIMVRTNFGGYLNLNKKVVSMREMKFKNIVRQETDFSCGSASLATIMRYFYNDNRAEEDIVNWLLNNGDIEKIKEKGFSLLDLKMYAENAGYKADGYMVKPEHLSKIKIPAIVLLNINGYAHFVVLKGVLGNEAYIADPALGNKKMPMDEFLTAWNGIVFVVYGQEMLAAYNRFEGPLSVDKAEGRKLADLMMRNLFMDPSEFRR